jgi:hypothetical protein
VRQLSAKELMKDIICKASDCAHNDRGACRAGAIQVGGREADDHGDTHCETYVPHANPYDEYGRDFLGLLKRNADTFSMGAYQPPDVDCTALKCLYNRDRKCSAPGIEIASAELSSLQHASCETFRLQ